MIVRFGDKVLGRMSRQAAVASASRLGAPIALSALFCITAMAIAVALPAPTQSVLDDAKVFTDARPALPLACAGETWPNYSDGCIAALRTKSR